MLIRTTEEILDYAGTPLPFQPGSDRPTMLRDVVHMALNNPLPDEEASMTQKAEFYRLTQLFYSDVTVEISPSDAALIEERAGALLTPLIYGRVCELFERQSSLAAVRNS